MIPPRSLARMIEDRSSSPESMAHAVVEAVMLRAAFEHIDDNLLRIEAHATAKPDDEHAVMADVVIGLRKRIRDELAHVDRVLIRSTTS